jgi:hypothetical protein
MSVAELLSTINHTSASITCSFLPTYIMGLIDYPVCRKCGAQEETRAHILWESETSGVFLLDPEYVRSLGLGTMWTFIKWTGLT